MQHLTSLLPLPPGTRLKGGQYEIIDLTSNPGGFGRIYRAYGSRPNRDGSRRVTAIKEFHVQEFESLEAEWSSMYSFTRAVTQHNMDVLRAKFYQEAKMLSLLYHQLDRHLPQIHGQVWEESDGRLFYAMTYVDGMTLRETLKSRGTGSTVSEERAADYIIQMGKVLHKAHEHGLVHADVSPNNIMLRRGLHFAVLVDWGNAKSYNDNMVLDQLDDAQLRTFRRYQDALDKASANISEMPSAFAEEMGIGTGGYTAPREFWGKPQADVYSLAATMFYLLTGKDARMLKSEKYVAWARQELADHNVSQATIEAILHAMNVDAHHATKSIQEFLQELPKELVIYSLLNYSDHDKNN